MNTVRSLSFAGMLRRISRKRVIILAAAALWPYPSSEAAAVAQDALSRMESSVVVVEVIDGQQVVGSYSGIVAAREEVAIPCADDSSELSYRVRSTPPRDAQLAHRDVLRNLCLLQVAGLDAPPAQIAKVDALRTGQHVYAIGDALGMGLAVSDGVVSALRTTRRGTFIQFTAPIAPGSQGGGLFDEAGRLIGLLRYRQSEGQNVNFAVPAEWLSEIAARAASQTALSAAQEIAIGLARASKWEDLARHARARLEVARDDADAWRWLARSAEKTKADAEARDAYRELLAIEPDDVYARLGLGWAHHRLGQYAEALEAVRELLAWRREDARPWLLAANALIGLKRRDEVLKALKAAVAADPWSADAYLSLGVWTRDQGDFATAAGAFRMQAYLDPNNIDAWIDLANAYNQQNRYERALAAAEKALAIDANSADALIQKGRALIGAGRQSEGIKVLERAAQMKSSWPVVAWYWLAMGYLDVKLLDEALKAYREALNLDPKLILARQWLAWTLEQAGFYEEALAEIDTVEKERPQLAWIARRRGAILDGQGKDDQAVMAYEKSLAIEPAQPEVWRALVNVYRRSGRPADARRAYERLAELDKREANIAYRQNFLPFEVNK